MNTIPEQNSQGLNPDEAAASLAFATQMQQQMMTPQQQPQEGSVEPQQAPGEPQTPQPNETASLDPEALKKEILTDVEKTIKDVVKEEMLGLKEEIKSALDDTSN